MLRIGLTGGIGSGKSIVCQLFAKRGVPIIDTDEVAREVVAPGEPALQQLSKHFGSAIIDNDGQLNRSELREQVFRDNDKLEQLESILHPLIREQMRKQLNRLSAPYVILAIPLLLEKGWQSEVDRILVVDTSESLQRSRTISRDQVGEETVSRIMQAQISRDKRLADADDIIHNEGDYDNIEKQVELLHRRYLHMAATGKK